MDHRVGPVLPAWGAGAENVTDPAYGCETSWSKCVIP